MTVVHSSGQQKSAAQPSELLRSRLNRRRASKTTADQASLALAAAKLTACLHSVGSVSPSTGLELDMIHSRSGSTDAARQIRWLLAPTAAEPPGRLHSAVSVSPRTSLSKMYFCWDQAREAQCIEAPGCGEAPWLPA